jgi:hypothetical protein
MIRKLKSGRYRLYTQRRGRRQNLGTFTTREAAEQDERAVQYFTEALSVLTRPPAQRKVDRRCVIRRRTYLLNGG